MPQQSILIVFLLVFRSFLSCTASHFEVACCFVAFVFMKTCNAYFIFMSKSFILLMRVSVDAWSSFLQRSSLISLHNSFCQNMQCLFHFHAKIIYFSHESLNARWHDFSISLRNSFICSLTIGTNYQNMQCLFHFHIKIIHFAHESLNRCATTHFLYFIAQLFHAIGTDHISVLYV